MNNVCVFLGSNPGNRPEYAQAARDLAHELVRRDMGLVYGGSAVGLMRVIADTVMEAGGRVYGVIPQALVDKEIAHHGITELHVVDSMLQRKELMAELSDGFVALPGGIGTMDEYFEVFTWGMLGFHDKPLGLLDVCGYYEPLNAFMDRIAEEGFVLPVLREISLSDPTPAGLIDRMLAYTPPRVEKWIEKKKQL